MWLLKKIEVPNDIRLIYTSEDAFFYLEQMINLSLPKLLLYFLN